MLCEHGGKSCENAAQPKQKNPVQSQQKNKKKNVNRNVNLNTKQVDN
jgi:hypothetical protein